MGKELLTACCKGGGPLCDEYCEFYHSQHVLQHWNYSTVHKRFGLFFTANITPPSLPPNLNTSNLNFCGYFSCRSSVLAFHPGWVFSSCYASVWCKTGTELFQASRFWRILGTELAAKKLLLGLLRPVQKQGMFLCCYTKAEIEYFWTVLCVSLFQWKQVPRKEQEKWGLVFYSL